MSGDRVVSSVKASMVASVVFLGRFFWHDPRRPRLACLTEGRRRLSAASLLSPQQPVTTFFPWPLRAHSSRNQESRALAALYCVPAPSGCGSIASGLSPAIEAAMGGPEN
ncbi:hypothetical protein [Bradyrhizobium sp. CCBAU 51745]|uniref:hypothetical protein n=1 Tax=Bradyrhizobium sp. CCBAU 51745 TaxID=1325099 RepID=UPI0023066F2A|nr:hypothetical protein [Bradyrhizobium sp. CCBAU 51745]